MTVSLGKELRTGYVERETRGAEEVSFLDVKPPWAWSVTAASTLVVAGIAGFLFFGRIDTVERVRGIVLPESGVLSVSPENGGIARKILVTPGQRVHAGQPLVQVESGETDVGRAAASEDLRLSRDEAAAAGDAEDAAYKREIAALEQRRDLLKQRQASLDRTRELSAAQVDADKRMEASGLVSRSQINRDEADLEQGARLLIENRQEITGLEGDLNAARLRHEQQVLQRRHDVARSMMTLRTADLRAQDEIVKAGADGVVDTIVVHQGEPVHGGQMLLRLLPSARALRMICYIPERDRQYLTVGTDVQVTLDQMRDERRLHGRVVRIANFLAGGDEVDATVGKAVTVDYAGYGAEIIFDDAASTVLRAGMLGDVYVKLGRIHPISLLTGKESRKR